MIALKKFHLNNKAEDISSGPNLIHVFPSRDYNRID